MDIPVWAAVLIAGLTAGATYLAGVRPARIAAREAAADRDLARQERDDAREQWFVDRIDKAWALCRSPDDAEQRAGVRMLRVLLQEPRLTRLVSTILDEVANDVFGSDLTDLRTDWERTGRLPDVDVVVDDDVRATAATAVSADEPRGRLARQLTVTRLQAELASAEVEADRARHRTPDPLLVRIAALAVPIDHGAPASGGPDGEPHADDRRR